MKKIKYLLLFVVLLAIDLITKQWAFTSFSDGSSMTVIPKVLEFNFTKNTGAAWGMFSGHGSLLSILALAGVIFFLYLFFKLPSTKHYTPLRILLVGIIAGAVGNNLFDRVIYGYVRDFIYFKLIDFPVFNVADMYIVVSVIVFFLLTLFYYKEEDLQFLSKSKKKAGDSEEQ